MRTSMRIVALAFVAAWGPIAQAQLFGRANPGGYWEGKASAYETPMKDANKELMRKVDAEFWFTVTWDGPTSTGTVAGEAQAVYDSVLKVENMPKATAAAPGGGTIKFEPSVGGRLEGDNKRKFPIVGVVTLDREGNGTMILRKVNDPLAGQPGMAHSYDAPMEFVMRADPGISGTTTVRGVTVNADTSGNVGVGVENKGGFTKNAPKAAPKAAPKTPKGGRPIDVPEPEPEKQEYTTGASQGVNTGISAEVIIQRIPMTPFSPFASAPGTVSKRTGGPFMASFESKDAKGVVKWSARQVSADQRPVTLTPEMRREIEEMIRAARRQRR